MPAWLKSPKVRDRLCRIVDRRIEELTAETQAEIRRIDERRAQRAALRDQRRVAECREACKSLHEFVRRGWHVLEPSTDFIDSRHVEVICEHLEAVAQGRITRLQINVPPGSMKSLLVSVFFQAYEWGPCGKPGLRYFTTSYTDAYSTRDARKCRDLIQSDWYQTHWPIELVRAGETSFENTERGNREAMPFTSLTSGRGNRVIIDDPHSTEQAESDTERRRVTRIFRESVPSRVNDPRKDAIIVVMHRLHPQDVCGVIDRLGLSYDKLILPMEFEPDRVCRTSIGFKDWRTKKGELLCPERFPQEVLARDKKVLTSYAYAGQYQQRPAPREGGIFKREWLPITKRVPERVWRVVRRWDLAATKASELSLDPDWTVGVKMSRSGERFYIEDVIRFRDTANEVRKTIKATAVADGKDVEVYVPQEPGQAGKDQGQSLVAMLAPYVARARRETGSKEVRAEPFAAQCEARNVFLVEGAWNEAFLDEISNFPVGHDDQVDAAAGAFAELFEETIPNIRLDAGSFHRANPAKIGEATRGAFST